MNHTILQFIYFINSISIGIVCSRKQKCLQMNFKALNWCLLLHSGRYASVTKSTVLTLGSWSSIFLASSPNVVGNATCACKTAFPSIVQFMYSASVFLEELALFEEHGEVLLSWFSQAHHLQVLRTWWMTQFSVFSLYFIANTATWPRTFLSALGKLWDRWRHWFRDFRNHTKCLICST